MKRNIIHTYYEPCSSLDTQVSAIPKTLEETGLDESTHILYCTDYSDTIGEHGLFLRSTIYEGSVSIPTIFSRPDIWKGKRDAAGVSLAGIYPITIECLGGAMCEEDRRLPGRSFLAFAEGKKEPERTVYSKYPDSGVHTGEFMLRRGRFRYIHYMGERPQLFDSKEGPEERRNLTKDPEYCEVMGRMEKGLHTLADPKKAEEDVRITQRALLDRSGDQEVFPETSHPSLFPPIPDLEER